MSVDGIGSYPSATPAYQQTVSNATANITALAVAEQPAASAAAAEALSETSAALSQNLVDISV